MKFRSSTITWSLVVLIVATFLSTGCSKEGPAGPAGPAGAAGAAGPAGPAGAAGAKGDPGTANVIYSDWLDVTFDADTVHNGNVIDTVGYSATINAPKLTSAIVSGGEMKVYLNAGTTANPVVVPLPLDFYFINIFDIVLTPYFQVGKINILATDDASTFISSGQKAWQYRYILIPGGTPSGRKASINWNNYNEVKAYLGLKD